MIQSPDACTSCGTPIIPGTLDGMCPACVQRVALNRNTEHTSGQTECEDSFRLGKSASSARWQPPPLDHLQVILPQYQVIALLGRGGMGAVYKAVQKSLDRVVALKILPADLGADDGVAFAERFKNEARLMAKLRHPAIVDVYDFGETADGLLYIAMEYMDGTDVARMIQSQGRLKPKHALAITAHVCDALACAHQRGIIHRDIKPANILIARDGTVKVADFGLAKQSDPALSGLTKTNMAVGTPDFLAPEALISGVALDGRADLYALGVTLYQMLTGELPRGIWKMPGQKLGIDPRFDAIISKALQTERDARYSSVWEIRRELDLIMTTPPPRPADVEPMDKARDPAASMPSVVKVRQAEASPQPSSRTRLQDWTGAAIVLAVSGAILWFFTGPLKPSQNPANVAITSDSKPPAELPPIDLQFGGHSYRVIQGRYSWDEARLEAERMGGHLATVSSKSEQEALVGAFGPFIQRGWWNLWLGGRRLNKAAPWQWVTGEPFEFTAWHPGEPNGSRFPQHLALWRPKDPTEQPAWDDLDGPNHDGGRRGYIIEWETSTPPADNALRQNTLLHGGHRYEFVPGPWSWDLAKAEAEHRGGHLATLTSQQEHDAVVAAFSPRLHSRYSSMWLGGYRINPQATWWWVTGEDFRFTNWDQGEPNSSIYPSYLALWRHEQAVDVFNWVDGPYQYQDFASWVGFLIEWDTEKAPSPATKSRPVAATKGKPFVNSLGMRLVPVTRTEAGTEVLFSIWETRRQDYLAFSQAQAAHYHRPLPELAGMPAEPAHPASGVTWTMAVAFCHWLTTEERRKKIIGPHDLYRLPSDQEWSIAAGLKEPQVAHLPEQRNLVHRSFIWGDSWPPPPGAGNFADESARPLLAGGPPANLPFVHDNLIAGLIEGYHDAYPTTAPVGRFPPNAAGLHDMAGNVQEWCLDLFGSTSNGSYNRVMRGGAWVDGAFDGRLDAAARFEANPGRTYAFRGFRVVLETGR